MEQFFPTFSALHDPQNFKAHQNASQPAQFTQWFPRAHLMVAYGQASGLLPGSRNNVRRTEFVKFSKFLLRFSDFSASYRVREDSELGGLIDPSRVANLRLSGSIRLPLIRSSRSGSCTRRTIASVLYAKLSRSYSKHSTHKLAETTSKHLPATIPFRTS